MKKDRKSQSSSLLTLSRNLLTSIILVFFGVLSCHVFNRFPRILINFCLDIFFPRIVGLLTRTLPHLSHGMDGCEPFSSRRGVSLTYLQIRAISMVVGDDMEYMLEIFLPAFRVIFESKYLGQMTR